MPRALEEWVGKTEDTPIPDRVKDRILQDQTDAEGVIRCALCGQPFDAKNKPIFDHKIALIMALPGQRLNREDNIHGIGSRCCNPEKTARDQAVKSKVASVRKKHLGFKAKSRRPFPGGKDDKWKKPINGRPYLRQEE